MFAVAAKDFVDSEFPREHRVKIPGALETAYAAQRGIPVFSGVSPLGRKKRQIERDISAGQLARPSAKELYGEIHHETALCFAPSIPRQREV